MKKEKKLLALLLTFVLCIGMLPTSAFAMDFTSGNVSSYDGNAAVFDDGTAGGAGQTVQTPTPAPETQTTPAAENEEPNVEEITVEEETPGAEVTPGEEEIPTEETTPADDSIIVEEPETTEPTPTPETTPVAEENNVVNSDDIFTSVPDEVADDSEIAMPAQDFNGELDDVKVIVNAPEGAFPEGTVMTVSEADEEAVQAAAEAAEAQKEDVKAVDITFTVNKEKIQPAVGVKVTLEAEWAADMKEPVVIHVNDELKTEFVKDPVKEEKEISFTTEEFSVYAVTEAVPEEAEVETEDVSLYADGDVNANHIVAIHYVFENNTQAAQSWSASLAEGSTYTNTVSYPEVVGYEPRIPTGLPEGVTADEEGIKFDLTVQTDVEIKVIYQPAEVKYTVNYYQQNVNDDNYTLTDTETETGYTEDPIGISYEEVKDKYAGFYGLLFDESATIAADGSTVVDIYYDRNYYLMSFDLDGGYGVEPIYARYGTEISVGTPERPGYEFSGWDQPIPTTMPAESVTYTALWNAERVNYTVVFWYENANDDDYSYAGSLIESGLSGQEITSVDYANVPFAGRDREHFTYNRSINETKEIDGDGSTVLNVYFTRNEYTLTFRSKGRWNYTVYGTITAKYQADIADLWPTAGTLMAGSSNRVPNNLYYWGYENAITGEDVLQATKIYTMTDEVCGEGGVDFIANTSRDLVDYTINYYLESLTGEGIWHDSTLYERSDEYSQTLRYERGVTGWQYKMIDGFTAADDEASSHNRTFNLYYTRNRHTITFYDNHGTTVASISDVMYQMPLSNVTIGEEENAISNLVPDYPSDLEPGAYEFGGWYTTSGCFDGSEADFENGTMPNANLAFYAKWVPVTHTVTTYMDNTFESQIGEPQTVSHGYFAEAPEDPTNGNYTFVGWFYMDGDQEKAFDFESMPVRQDMDVYAKWSSNVLVEYTINYQLANGTTIADSTTGSALAGTTRTFEAKTEGELYEDYQTGYFPVVRSHSFVLDINGGDSNVYTFIYKPATIVPYTVKYLEADTNRPLAEKKIVDNNTHAVVTETAEIISGYLPDAFQKRLILTVPEEGAPTAEDNVLIFYYTKDDEHAIVSVTHYLVNGEVTTQYQHSEEVGTIGQTYTREPVEISGYSLEYATINDVTWEEEGNPSEELTAAGLNFEFYYTPNYFYVYHSSDQSVDTLNVPDDGTFDITELVKDGYLYGGYYSGYKKAGTYKGGPEATYDGTSYRGAISGCWDLNAAYKDVPGSAMKPEKNKTYYLKEVPEAYFQPTMALVYDAVAQPNTAEGLYLISATDDKNYAEFGLIAENTYKQEKSYALAFTFQQKLNVGTKTVITAKTAFEDLSSGYLGVWNADSELEIKYNDFTYRPYIKTLDGVTVSGKKIRTVYTGDLTYRNTLDEGLGVHKVDVDGD